MKIVTVCRAGLCRSVALADILKLHYENTDVIPVGISFNSDEIKSLLFAWADRIIVMEKQFVDRVPHEFSGKIMICDVGPDIWNNPKHPELISKVWNWLRDNNMGLVEHSRIL